MDFKAISWTFKEKCEHGEWMPAAVALNDVLTGHHLLNRISYLTEALQVAYFIGRAEALKGDSTLPESERQAVADGNSSQ